MSLDRFPALKSLYEDLTNLSLTETAREAHLARLVEAGGPHVVSWPGLGDFALTEPQFAVVQSLLATMLGSRSPESDGAWLLRISGSDASSLADVFAGSPAWGRLVVPGAKKGTYKLDLPEVPDA